MTAPGKPDAALPGTHRWKFFRAGGFDQVLLETGADLMALKSLDQKLWVALSCPVPGIEFDPKTLAFIDADGDGHVRVPEVLEAIRWAGAVLKDPDLIVKRPDCIPLSAIDEACEEGKAVLDGANFVLSALGKPGAGEIRLDDVCDMSRIFSRARFNGDGIVPAKAATDPALGLVIEDIIECLGPETDRSGDPGVTAGKVERFYSEARALADWHAAGEGPDIRPFGDETAACYGLFLSLRPRIEDYFRRCRLAAYDIRAASLLGPQDAEYLKLSSMDLGGSMESVAQLPLAVAAPGAPLRFFDRLNPAWSEAMREFGRTVAEPLLGEVSELSEDGWAKICASFRLYEAWLASRPATALEKLDPGYLKAILAAGGREALLELAASDKEVEPAVAAVASVEKLIRYCRDLHVFVNNFVSFRNFYTRKGKATFQAGTLYLDGRSCELCVSVADVNRHASIATMSRVYLLYCECTRRGGGEKMNIAAGFTAGDSDMLMEGRNGVFYDRAGRDWDATIVRIVEHPIGIRQAFWSPYKRLARMIGEQFHKMAAARQKAAEDRRTLAMIAAGQKAAAGQTAAAPPPAFDIARFAGIFAAIGLAIGAIGGALASMMSGLFRLDWWQVPLVAAGGLLLVSGPSVLIAWAKLRQRNLGPILDANGWAVNARAKINIPFGNSLTALAKLPENAERSLTDPFAEKKRPWKLYFYLLVMLLSLLILWRAGYFSGWLGR
ncbi:MAG: hypothetical protein HY896_02920 [Deltaproteobacteria bacterium]|nr:hypothetical protein [Deltaproteobacteria bacterium]